jgi:uncharacterized membrane protein YbhN (UPF0104 family)
MCRDLRLAFIDITAWSTTVVAAFASNLLLVGASFVLAYGPDVNVGFLTWLVVMPIVLLMATLPISVGGWGTREIAMVYMLGLFAVPPDLAAAVSIQFGLTNRRKVPSLISRAFVQVPRTAVSTNAASRAQSHPSRAVRPMPTPFPRNG